MSGAEQSRARTLAVLFREMFLLSALVLGGGYVILSVADRRFSRKFGWIREGELFEMLPVFQMIPGIIGGHTAVYLGQRVAGAWGAIVALAGTALPSVLVFLAVSVTYRSIPVDSPVLAASFLGLRAALTGFLLETVVRTWRKSVSGIYGYVAFVLAVTALVPGGLAPARIIVAGMVAGVALELVRDVRTRRSEVVPPRVFGSFGTILPVFLGYGLIAFGGGFVLVPVYLRDFVGEAAPYLQLPSADFANVMALTQITPGPVAVNCATFFGYGFGGVAGAVVATLALLLPGLVLLLLALRSLERFRASILVRGVFTGVRPVTAALLAAATWSFAGMSVWRTDGDGVVFSPMASALAVLTFVAVRSRRVGPVAAILFSALAGAGSALIDF